MLSKRQELVLTSDLLLLNKSYNIQIYPLCQFKAFKDAYNFVQSYMLCCCSKHKHLFYVSRNNIDLVLLNVVGNLEGS